MGGRSGDDVYDTLRLSDRGHPPLHSISMAVERKTRNGDSLGETQKLTRTEAYRKMTLDAAKLNDTEDKEGSIETGKYADLVVLDQNPYEDETVLSDDLVQMMLVDGRIVYER